MVICGCYVFGVYRMVVCNAECIEKIGNFLEINYGKLSTNESGRVTVFQAYSLFTPIIFNGFDVYWYDHIIFISRL
jgi:hypothetical protein